ncbi:fimbria/pilus outer membrane usher protein [Acinetobacter rathckeae]|uniref:fimbria/pilus outer membrane usher protein n=1 Tax=Acinetobacter rathckeae TaxID=2605272 RepID=UPI0018A252C5|nr:fimbria/pilus outer membrane usher protein [Acinetobacter rathckeae]MBF7686722.1 fimbrial biogenesis outer membrane usher protein [Acinetobacter rathckeae]MBF7695745.1 fimbrial biogenesis outer membrane usher protein [Acinetobacter rathckeae]
MAKKIYSHTLTLFVSMITYPMVTHAESNTLQEADFDPAFIVGNNKSIDVSRFKYSNPVLPGEYNLDVYVNGNWFGKRKMVFQIQPDQKIATTCFEATTLLSYGVKKDALSQSIDFAHKNNQCVNINQWIKEAYYDFDTSSLRLDVYIPQYAMQSNAQGYVDPAIWDRGINAGFLSYNATAYQSSNRSSADKDSLNAFMSLSMGANIAGWQLRHNAQVQWSNADTQTKKSLSYTTNNTYIQKAFPDYRGVITIGDSFTNGEVFDSLSYRGIDFSSDDRMLPNSLQGYAPQIRGIAKTNAKIEVRQQGQLIYQTNVAPGPFEINDLYPTGFGGNIEVRVIEADGQIQKFAVPYASVVQMLRPKLDRYSMTLGKLRDNSLRHHPSFAQGKYQRGLNNHVTGFTGFQIADDYMSFLLGSAFATPIGAVSLDWTHANARLNQKTVTGQSYRLSYSKLIVPTSTNLTLAAYRYSSENFYSLRDTSIFNNLIDQGINTAGVGKQRSQFQITLNQGLPQKLGNVYLVGSWSDYWNRSQRSRQYQFGYNNNYREITYGISATHRLLDTVGTSSKSDTEYVFSVNFPLSIKKTAANVSATSSKDSQSVGISGMVNDRLSYGANVSKQNNINAYNINSSYKTDVATLAASYSDASSYQQMMLSIRGNVVLHAGGLQFGPEQGQTIAIVYAPNAVGAKVNNLSGLRINKSGYAVVPYLTPYRINDVTLDPQDMSDQVELQETTQRIAPYAGSITQLSFATKIGYAIYIDAKQADQTTLPFAAEISSSKGDVIGLVGQGSLAYLRTQLTKDTVTVKWGDNPSQQCHISYDLTNQLKKTQASMLMTEAICQ